MMQLPEQKMVKILSEIISIQEIPAYADSDDDDIPEAIHLLPLTVLGKQYRV
jgi:hypothetical protein